MVTENGTVKTSVELDVKLHSELNKNLRTLGILYIVCGAVIFVLGAVLVGISLYDGTGDWDAVMLIVGAAFAGFGIFFLITFNNANRTAQRMKRVEEVEFFSDYMIEREYTDGELTSMNKVYYRWIVRVRETKNYLFLYNTRVTALAVDKNSLPPNELSLIRNLLGRATQMLPVQNMQNMQNPQNPQDMGGPAQTDAPPEEPFPEMTENNDNKEE